jgi:hypothetical protein
MELQLVEGADGNQLAFREHSDFPVAVPAVLITMSTEAACRAVRQRGAN